MKTHKLIISGTGGETGSCAIAKFLAGLSHNTASRFSDCWQLKLGIARNIKTWKIKCSCYSTSAWLLMMLLAAIWWRGKKMMWFADVDCIALLCSRPSTRSRQRRPVSVQLCAVIAANVPLASTRAYPTPHLCLLVTAVYTYIRRCRNDRTDMFLLLIGQRRQLFVKW